MKILKCEEEDCPGDFNMLESCGESHIRTCMECFKRVVLVSDQTQADAMIEMGDKVAINEKCSR